MPSRTTGRSGRLSAGGCRGYSSPPAPRARCRSSPRSASPCRRGGRLGGDLPAVAEDRDGVGDAQDVVEEVRDEDDAAAAVAQPRSTANRRSTSGGDSAEVGSSRMMMRAPENSTRAISISCCRPIGRSPMPRHRIDVDAEVGELLAAPRAPWRASRTRPRRLVGCLPRKTFSATVRSGATLSS